MAEGPKTHIGDDFEGAEVCNFSVNQFPNGFLLLTLSLRK